MTRANTISNSIKLYLVPERNEIFERYLNTDIEGYSRGINSRIIVVDKNNSVRADSNGEYINEIFKHKEIQSSLSGEISFGNYKFEDYGHVLYTSVPIFLDDKVIGATIISTSLNELYDKMGQISDKLIIISITSIFFIAILAFLFAGFLAKPIKKFTEIITKVSQDQLNQRVEINTHDEFKKMANAFNLMISKLDQVDRQRKDFVANVSHELRTPLSSVKLLSESLIHQNEDDINIYKEFLQDINSEVDRLNKIIDDLLTHVDLDREKLSLNLKKVSVNVLLERIVSRLKPLAKEKDIDLKLVLKNQIQIEIDSDKIQQAIINIIHNAIKYTPNDGKILVELYEKGYLTVIKVQDNGIGISEDSLEHIFDRFYRVDKARARNTGGTGLGLSIAYQIISLHRGTIDVESEIGKGSTFFIKIPKSLI